MPQYAVFLYAPLDDDVEPDEAASAEHQRHSEGSRPPGTSSRPSRSSRWRPPRRSGSLG